MTSLYDYTGNLSAFSKPLAAIMIVFTSIILFTASGAATIDDVSGPVLGDVDGGGFDVKLFSEAPASSDRQGVVHAVSDSQTSDYVVSWVDLENSAPNAVKLSEVEETVIELDYYEGQNNANSAPDEVWLNIETPQGEEHKVYQAYDANKDAEKWHTRNISAEVLGNISGANGWYYANSSNTPIGENLTSEFDSDAEITAVAFGKGAPLTSPTVSDVYYDNLTVGDSTVDFEAPDYDVSKPITESGVDFSTTNYKSIQNALNDVHSGDTVNVHKGLYNESLEITTSDVTLRSANPDSKATVRFEAEGSTTTEKTISVNADNVVVQDLVVERVADSNREGGEKFAHGIVVRSSNGIEGVEVKDTEVVGKGFENDNYAAGIMVIDGRSGQAAKTSNVNLVNNNVSGFPYGIEVKGYYGDTVENINVKDNKVNQSFKYGIVVGQNSGTVNKTVIENNQIQNSDEVGLYVLGSETADYPFPVKDVATDEITVKENEFESNSVQVQDDSGALNLTKVLENNAYDNSVVVRGSPIQVPKIFSSIQEAVIAADEGHTVSVHSGLYEERVDLNKSITLKGEGLPVVSFAPQSPTGRSTLAITADGAKAEGFEVQRTPSEDREDDSDHAQAVKISASNVEFKDSTISSQTSKEQLTERFDGLMVIDNNQQNVSDVVVSNNSVEGFYGGIVATTYYDKNLSDVEVFNNTVSENINGMVLKTHDQNPIQGFYAEDNELTNNKNGLYITGQESYQGYDLPGGINLSELSFKNNSFDENYESHIYAAEAEVDVQELVSELLEQDNSFDRFILQKADEMVPIVWSNLGVAEYKAQQGSNLYAFSDSKDFGQVEVGTENLRVQGLPENQFFEDYDNPVIKSIIVKAEGVEVDGVNVTGYETGRDIRPSDISKDGPRELVPVNGRTDYVIVLPESNLSVENSNFELGSSVSEAGLSNSYGIRALGQIKVRNSTFEGSEDSFIPYLFGGPIADGSPGRHTVPGAAISLERQAYGSELVNNSFENLFVGVQVRANETQVTGNQFRSNGAGLMVQNYEQTASNQHRISDYREERTRVFNLTGLNVSGNEFVENGAGASFVEDASRGSSISDVDVHRNLFRNIGYGVIANQIPEEAAEFEETEEREKSLGGIKEAVNATNNCWAHPTGPSGEGSGIGDAVSKGVIFDDWQRCNPNVEVDQEIDIDIKPDEINLNDNGNITVKVNISEEDMPRLEAVPIIRTEDPLDMFYVGLGTQDEIMSYEGAEPINRSVIDEEGESEIGKVEFKFRREDVSLSTDFENLSLIMEARLFQIPDSEGGLEEVDFTNYYTFVGNDSVNIIDPVQNDDEEETTSGGGGGSIDLTPRADAGSDVETTVGQQVDFDGSNSRYGDSFTWDFGDGESATGESASHTYSQAGTYTVELTVEGYNGEDATDTVQVEVAPDETETGNEQEDQTSEENTTDTNQSANEGNQTQQPAPDQTPTGLFTGSPAEGVGLAAILALLGALAYAQRKGKIDLVSYVQGLRP